MELGNTESSHDVTLAEEATTLCEQVKDMSIKCDINKLFAGHQESPLPRDFYKQVTDLRSFLDKALETVNRLQEVGSSPHMKFLKQGEGIPMREQPGRRKKTSGDSGVGSSTFGSSISSRCPTSSRGSHHLVLPSAQIGSIPEGKEEMFDRFFKTADFEQDAEEIIQCELGKDVLSAETQTEKENDLSKSAVEHTETSESDNEKQPIYSSDESRLSSLKSCNNVQVKDAESQTVLYALDPRSMANIRQVTEQFYQCEFPDETNEDLQRFS